jgi:hypothetical protein
MKLTVVNILSVCKRTTFRGPSKHHSARAERTHSALKCTLMTLNRGYSYILNVQLYLNHDIFNMSVFVFYFIKSFFI